MKKKVYSNKTLKLLIIFLLNLFIGTLTAQQTISYSIKTSNYVRHVKGEEKLLTDFDRVNMRSYEELDSFIVQITE